jgi:hypothetical protein
MKKISLLLFFGFQLLFPASTEQIVQYLSLSHSEEQILSIERVFDSMRQTQESNESNESTNQVSIVYQEYLEEHLSSDEIDKILELYRQPTMERYVTEVKSFLINKDDMDAFLANLKEEPLRREREEIVNDVVDVLINEELQLNFYRSMMQRYQPQSTVSEEQNRSKENNASKMTSREEGYVNSMKKAAKNHILYGTQVFSLEEMNELKEGIDSSIFKKVKRVENEALVQIMNNYIRGVTSKPKKVQEKKVEKKKSK